MFRKTATRFSSTFSKSAQLQYEYNLTIKKIAKLQNQAKQLEVDSKKTTGDLLVPPLCVPRSDPYARTIYRGWIIDNSIHLQAAIALRENLLNQIHQQPAPANSTEVEAYSAEMDKQRAQEIAKRQAEFCRFKFTKGSTLKNDGTLSIITVSPYKKR